MIYNYFQNCEQPKIYQIMVSFNDYYNAISLDRLSLKIKIRKD